MKLNYIYKKSSIFIHMGILLLSIALTACSSSAPASTGSRQAPAVNVKPVKAVISPIELTVEYPATLLPYQEVNVTPESTGKVVSLDIDVGMQIEKGQTLFHLESTDLQNQFKQQQLSAEQALNKAQTAYEDAKTTLEKNQILYASGVIAAQTISDLQTKLKNATFDLNTATENLKILKEKIVPQTQSSLDSNSVKLENSIVRSPISGVVSARNISAGEVVNSSTRALTVIDTSILIANVGIPYKMVDKIQKGQKVQMKLGNDDNRKFEGIVDAISPSTDNTSQTYFIRIKIDNKNNALRSGAFIRVFLPAEKKDSVLTVPNQAILIENGIRYIFVVEEGKVKKKSVNVGLSNDKVSEITSSLKEGDLVITEGQIFINDGQRVNIVNADGTANSGQKQNKPEGSNQQGQTSGKK